ncbi:MAG: hypothetical protein WC091_11710 [Sulfuricellaceae bacterium]
MSNVTTLALNPSWPSSSSGKTVVLYIQAYATSSFVQNVSITGPGLTVPLVASSDTSKPFGTQFLNKEIHLPYKQYPNWLYQVTITYNNPSPKPSDVIGNDDTSVGPAMFTAIAVSNDGGSDKDYNDCIVQISAFNNSTD